MDTPTQESSGSSTRPRRQLLTSRQAQDLLSTLLDGEISDNSVVEEPSTISDEEFDGSSLGSRSRSNTSSSERDDIFLFFSYWGGYDVNIDNFWTNWNIWTL